MSIGTIAHLWLRSTMKSRSTRRTSRIWKDWTSKPWECYIWIASFDACKCQLNRLIGLIKCRKCHLCVPFRFVLVKFSNDTIVQPIDTEWFQFYVPNQDKQIQAFSESNAAVSTQSQPEERIFQWKCFGIRFIFRKTWDLMIWCHRINWSSWKPKETI